MLPMIDLFSQTKIKDIMTEAICICKDDPFSSAQQKFKDNRSYYLIVVDDEDKYVGTLSQKFLFKAQSPRKIISEEMSHDPAIIIDGDSFYDKEVLDSYILSKVMHKGALSLLPDDNVLTAVKHMSQKKISCIPVVDQSLGVCGILTNQEVIDFVMSQLK